MGSSDASGILIGLALLVAPCVGAAQCLENSVDLRGPTGTAHFSVEVADDAAERSRGLMFREHMASSAGMLFVYDRPQPVAFWMKNTLIPLDMVFADGTGLVRRVHSKAIPQDTTPIDGGDDIAFVLEINGGLAERLGIEPGWQLRHSAVPQSGAVWPCSGE
jgi:uncharacterized protein